MRKFLAAAAVAAVAFAASAASATTFVGSYTPTVYTGSNGLEIEQLDSTPGAGTGFTFNLTGNGASTNFSLFRIWTEEGSVDSSDENHRAITVLFSFTAPGSASGTAGGETSGIDGVVNSGHVHWTSPAVINFGGAGTVTISLNDADFNAYDPPGSGNNDDLYPTQHPENYYAQISAHAVLSNVVTAGVPEPASWALMIGGFGMAGASLRRRRAVSVAAA